MNENLFENAKFGDRFVCRNGTIAYYCRKVNKDEEEDDGKCHTLMTQDHENDFIMVYPNGKVFDIEKLDTIIAEGQHKGKTICEMYGWNRDEMVNFRLDIVGRYESTVGEEKLDELAKDYATNCCDCINDDE